MLEPTTSQVLYSSPLFAAATLLPAKREASVERYARGDPNEPAPMTKAPVRPLYDHVKMARRQLHQEGPRQPVEIRGYLLRKNNALRRNCDVVTVRAAAETVTFCIWGGQKHHAVFIALQLVLKMAAWVTPATRASRDWLWSR